MKKSSPNPGKSIISRIKEALSFNLADHLLIRACQATEASQKQQLRGLLPPPSRDKTYGPQDLTTWARILVKKRNLKPFRVKASGNPTVFEHLLAIGLRVTGYLGSLGVPVACAIAGVTAGLAFLPMRIFTSDEVTLPQILIPVVLGSVFVFWHSIRLIRHLLGLLENDFAKGEKHASQEGVAENILVVCRRVLPPYLRWNTNLGWCVFWVVVLASTSLEYAAHQRTDRDYVYRSQYMPLQSRLKWLNRFSVLLPDAFALQEEDLIWGDQDYRNDGYRLVTNDTPHVVKASAASTILRGYESVHLRYTPDPDARVVALIFHGSTNTVQGAPPFHYQTTARSLSDVPVNATLISGDAGAERFTLQYKNDGVVLRAVTRPANAMIFLTNGKAASTNTTQFIHAIEHLPLRIDVRDAGPTEPTVETGHPLLQTPNENPFVAGADYLTLLGAFKGRNMENSRDEPSPLLATFLLKDLGRNYSVSRLEEPPGYARRWFMFVFGVILTFGLVPRLVALPIFCLLYAGCKLKLYRELGKPPFSNIIDELNQRSTSSEHTDPVRYWEDPPGHKSAPRTSRPLPHKDLLAIGYEAVVTAKDVKRLKRCSDFSLFERKAGDTNTNIEVLKWISRHQSVGQFLICTRLTFPPDRPLVSFLQEVVAKGVSCELAFVDMPEVLGDASDRLADRIGVWRRGMEKAGLGALLPHSLRGGEAQGGINEF